MGKIQRINRPLSFLFLLIYLTTGNPRRIFSGLHLSSSKLWMSLESSTNSEDDGGVIMLVMQDKLGISPSFHWSSPYRRTLWHSDTFLKHAKKLLDHTWQVTRRGTDWRRRYNYIQKRASLRQMLTTRWWANHCEGSHTTVASKRIFSLPSQGSGSRNFKKTSREGKPNFHKISLKCKLHRLLLLTWVPHQFQLFLPLVIC